jgi:hypothetical protein
MRSAEINFQIFSTLTICSQIHAPATFISRKIFSRLYLEIMVVISENLMGSEPKCKSASVNLVYTKITTFRDAENFF